MSHKQEVYDKLTALSIPYLSYEHEAAHTIADCYALPYAAPDLVICKNILLCNRQKTNFYLYIMPPDKPFRTADVSKLLGVSRLSFAPEESLPELFGLYSGSLCPFAMWFAAPDAKVRLVFDSEVRKTGGRIAFHPCDNTGTVVFDDDVFWQMVLPTLGDAVFLDVPWPESK